MALVGKKFPNITVDAISFMGDNLRINVLEEAVNNKKKVILFWYPKDFTFVCPTELIAFQEKIEEFTSRNAVLVGASTDSEFSHWKWLQTPQNAGGIQGVKYPLFADHNLMVSKAYDVLAGYEDYTEEGEPIFVGEAQAYRGLFLIDKEGIVRHQVVNDMPLGRSVEEVIRVLDALQFTEEYGEVCPANWKKGDKALNATQEGISDYLSH